VEILWVVILSTQNAGREVLHDEETFKLLEEEDDPIVLHLHIIPEHFF
jgi:hypothetical protein